MKNMTPSIFDKIDKYKIVPTPSASQTDLSKINWWSFETFMTKNTFVGKERLGFLIQI